MPAYGVTIRLDTATPGIERIRAGLAARAFHPAVGEALKLTAQKHFQDKEANPESHKTAARLGAKPTGLFAQFSRATSWRAGAEGVSVAITHPAIRQRIEGGPIRAVNAKFLTIPANAAAYGKTVGSFGSALKWGWYRKDGELRGYLYLDQDVKETKTRMRKGKAKQVTKTKFKAGVYFWAVRETKPQKPDPTVIPNDAAFFAGLDASIGQWLEEQTNG